MAIVNYITQPDDQSTSGAISQALQEFAITQMDIAAAYMTVSGIKVLFDVLNRHSVAQSADITKRWITSFDYCRTDPLALEAILSLPKSSVRIYGADASLSNNGVPYVPFHPKTFLFSAPQKHCVIAGSGNISRSGLSRGIELGLAVSIDRSIKTEEYSAIAAVEALQNSFERRWKDSSPLRESLLSKYKLMYEKAERIKNAVPTEDDTASSDRTRGSLSSDNLKTLRICKHLWIEAGNITRNRGKDLPGNQLMMKRLTRVYFGFDATSIPENSPIGSIKIAFNGSSFDNYSLTYSDNKMDKLVLPIPGTDGPDSYDGKLMLFEQVGLNRFRLSLGTSQDRSNWLRKSRLVDGAFTMSSGRQWGVF
jgi:HKD family nuclease